MDENVAIVTGGAQGIGRSIAISLLSQGYRVMIFDINLKAGNETEKELQQKFGETKVSFTQCDVTDTEKFKEAYNQTKKQCGYVSVMVNNAGTCDEFNIEKCIALNLKAVIQGSNLAIDNMRKDKGGKGGIIVNVSSVAAVTSAHFMPTYCATKSAVLNFTRSWSKNPKCEEMGLTFICLCPSLVATSFAEDMVPRSLDPPFAVKAIKATGMLKLDFIEKAFNKLMTDRQNGSVLEVSIGRTEYIKSDYPIASVLPNPNKKT